MENKGRCPHCNSTNSVFFVKESNNGILGPGYKAWVKESYYSCQDCKQIFNKIINENTKI